MKAPLDPSAAKIHFLLPPDFLCCDWLAQNCHEPVIIYCSLFVMIFLLRELQAASPMRKHNPHIICTHRVPKGEVPRLLMDAVGACGSPAGVCIAPVPLFSSPLQIYCVVCIRQRGKMLFN